MTTLGETYVRDFERRKKEAAKQRRSEFFADREDIPDLDFLPPDCPICWLPTEYDDGYFICAGCDLAWPQSGYGHLACRADGSKIATPTTDHLDRSADGLL